ncbi:MAG: thioredoxin fold domain-containing protein [Aquificaceae bacterium]
MLKLVAIALIVASCKDKAPSQKLSIIPSKPYGLLIFETKSCIYCKKLKKELSGKEFSEFDIFWVDALGIKNLEQNLISGQNLREKDLSKTLKVSQFPHLVFYDKGGQIKLEIKGYVNQKDLKCAMDFVKADAKIPYLQYAREKCI